MKYLLIVLPGAADHPAEELSGKTPLELAKIPHLHAFARMGKVGQAKLVTDRYEPSADTTLLNLLGYDAEKVYTSRGPLEAANLELKLEDNEVAFRMNFITESNGALADPTAGQISTKESKALINFLNKKVASEFVRFFAGSRYRHIAVLKDSHGFEALSAKTVAPETIIGEKIENFLPKGPGEELLKKLMYDAKLLLQDHEINQVRLDLQENPANMIWLWGQGKMPHIKKFREEFDLNGAILADAEFAKGLGRLAGLSVMEMNASPEGEDLQYEKVGKMVTQVLAEKDFVCVYLDGCEEASRAGDYKAKISLLEAADYFIFSKVKDYLENHKDLRVLVTPGYLASWKMRKITRDTVPFLIAGKNIMPDDVEKFSEAASKASAFKINKSQELIRSFVTKG